MKNVKYLALTIVTSLLAFNSPGGLVYDLPGTVSTDTSSTYALALRLDFNVNIEGSVSRIGVADLGTIGFVNNLQVAIYNLGTGDQVPGTFAQFSSGTKTVNSAMVMQDLNQQVTLLPGSYALIAANFTTSDPWYRSSVSSTAVAFDSHDGALTHIKGTNYYGGLQTHQVSTVQNTIADFGTMRSHDPRFEPVWGAATFDFTPVPEPEHYALAAIGMLGLVCFGRWAKAKRNAVA